MHFSPIWPTPDKNWNFDVSSLIVLIGEDLELQYRLSQRSFPACISAAPVVALQSYMRSYDFLLDVGNLSYSSPYGCKTAPLRNVRLENAIRTNKLLNDKEFNVYKVRPSSTKTSPTKKYDIILAAWTILTWILFGGILAFAILMPKTTWIGVANCAIFTGWSIIIRVIEYFSLRPATAIGTANLGGDDAIYILGRDNSAFVLKGTRGDIKAWTSRGLVYTSIIPDCEGLMKGLTRFISLLALLFIFSTIPNAHTMDQLSFILLNALGQINVLVGQKINSRICMAELEKEPPKEVASRTYVYANLIKEFKDVNQDNDWADILDLVPKTKRWATWRAEYSKDTSQDPKDLFNRISEGGILAA